MFIVCVDSFWTFSKFTKVWQSNADYCDKYSSGNFELENFNNQYTYLRYFFECNNKMTNSFYSLDVVLAIRLFL